MLGCALGLLPFRAPAAAGFVWSYLKSKLPCWLGNIAELCGNSTAARPGLLLLPSRALAPGSRTPPTPFARCRGMEGWAPAQLLHLPPSLPGLVKLHSSISALVPSLQPCLAGKGRAGARSLSPAGLVPVPGRSGWLCSGLLGCQHCTLRTWVCEDAGHGTGLEPALPPHERVGSQRVSAGSLC